MCTKRFAKASRKSPALAGFVLQATRSTLRPQARAQHEVRTVATDVERKLPMALAFEPSDFAGGCGF